MQVQAGGDLAQGREPAGKIVAGLQFLALDGGEGDEEAAADFGDEALRAGDWADGVQAGQVLQGGQPGEFGGDFGFRVIALPVKAEDERASAPGLVFRAVEEDQGVPSANS
jgi:hypothetical protein